MPIEDYRELLAEQSLTFLAGIPYVYHCHHYNLFHDQTIDDALGEAEGARVRTTAAHNAFRELLSAVFAAAGATTPAERISLATEVFAWMGQGRISLDVSSTGGRARSPSLHYGFAWREKYGARSSETSRPTRSRRGSPRRPASWRSISRPTRSPPPRPAAWRPATRSASSR